MLPDDSRIGEIEIHATPEDAGQRLDRWLSEKVAGMSRARLQTLIRAGRVSADATIREPRTPVKPGLVYRIDVPPPESSTAKPESLPLAIVYEDEALIVIDKPAGLVVHPSAGHATGTLVNALVAHCGESLSGIGGVARPGIVHRLDKDTSGLLVVAKTDVAHHGLSEQFKSHGRDGRLRRSYIAFVWGHLLRPKGSIDARLGRSRTNRLKVGVVSGEAGREAITHYEVIGVAKGKTPAGDASALRLTLETGRTHQIRVHLSHIGHPVIGDSVYGAGFKTRAGSLGDDARGALAVLDRQSLHAAELAFEHPVTGQNLSFNSPLPPDLAAVGSALGLSQAITPIRGARADSKKR